MKFVQVNGPPGSGKSTLSKKLAKKLNLRLIEIDAEYWLENWQQPDDAEFRQRLSKLLDDHPDGWLVDGGYSGIIDDVMQPRIDTYVYLRVSPFIAAARTAKRSFSRIKNHELLWGKNYETVRGALSLLGWVIKGHRQRDKRIKGYIESNPMYEVIILRGNRNANKWLDSHIK